MERECWIYWMEIVKARRESGKDYGIQTHHLHSNGEYVYLYFSWHFEQFYLTVPYLNRMVLAGNTVEEIMAALDRLSQHKERGSI